MSNVVITHFSPVFYGGTFQIDCYYEGLISALQKQGHDVLHVITSDFLEWDWNGFNEPYSQKIKEQVLSEIKAFKPELIISFNNSSIRGIEEAVNCPIILWDADSFGMFNDKDEILKNQDRYHYFAYSQKGLEDYDRFIDSTTAIKSLVPSATNIKREEMDKPYNISFIGNAFLNNDPALLRFLKDKPEYAAVSLHDFAQLDAEQKSYIKKMGVGLGYLQYQSTGLVRAPIILNLLDHGVHVFGPEEWLELGRMDSRIFHAYDPRLCFSEYHNALIYNRSYIALNASHPQNITGYPWRVLDILASSAALLTEFKSDLQKDFPKIDFAIYNSTSELHDVTKKLLKDSAWRKDYVLQCNEAIESNFRWKHRFKTMSEITGVDMSPKSTKGTYKRLTNNDPMIKFLFPLMKWSLQRSPTQKSIVKIIARRIIKQMGKSHKFFDPIKIIYSLARANRKSDLYE